MQFNSIEFIFYFLPLFLAVYLIVPRPVRHGVLLVGSLVFYGLASGGNHWWVLLLGMFTLLTYVAGLTMTRSGGRFWLIISLGLMAAYLIFFKLFRNGRYLPAGMSFYLFQMAAYLIDIYQRRCPAEKNILRFGSTMVMFPKLLSGPLMEPNRLRLESKYGKVSARNFRGGLQLLILGLGMKVLLANRLGGLWSQPAVIGYESISTPAAWLALTAYAMQLYFDFYGYSLMAMGLGRMLGYDLPANFLDPYVSKTVSEFYRRWHVTLGAWFREYLYIPLGGNRKGSFRTILNLAVVWLITGLWHGIGGNYLLWAGFLFLLIVNERLWLGKLMKRSNVLCHVYVVFAILLSWIPFAIGDWDQMLVFTGRLFGLGGDVINPKDFLIWGREYVGLLLAGILLATPLPRKVWEKIRHSTFADFLLLAVFWLVVYYIATAAQDPFLYFQY